MLASYGSAKEKGRLGGIMKTKSKLLPRQLTNPTSATAGKSPMPNFPVSHASRTSNNVDTAFFARQKIFCCATKHPPLRNKECFGAQQSKKGGVKGGERRRAIKGDITCFRNRGVAPRRPIDNCSHRRHRIDWKNAPYEAASHQKIWYNTSP